jgi:hypothetical protein
LAWTAHAAAEAGALESSVVPARSGGRATGHASVRGGVSVGAAAAAGADGPGGGCRRRGIGGDGGWCGVREVVG